MAKAGARLKDRRSRWLRNFSPIDQGQSEDGSPSHLLVTLYATRMSWSSSLPIMCPICITTALLITSGVAGTGGIAAVAMKKFGVKNAANKGVREVQPGPSNSELGNDIRGHRCANRGRGRVRERTVERDRQLRDKSQSEENKHKSMKI